MKSAEKKRPFTRKFWSYLIYLPSFIRAKIIRSKFKVDYGLPEELVLKQAETADEITQALRIVYDSYLDLNYIDANAAKLRLTKYHVLPTTVILVAKWKDEVVGTMTIIPDSGLGIPSDLTYDLSEIKQNGEQIAEISALSIKKNFQKRRGQLLLPLCKLMYQYCTNILQLDAVIIATVPVVEPFYTDVLLFKRLKKQSYKENTYVKGTPSTWCYLPLNDQTIKNYLKVYGYKTKLYNLHNFFVVEKTTNIQLPDYKKCIQAYTINKTLSMIEIFKNHPFLIDQLTENDKNIIKNIDVVDTLPVRTEHNKNSDRKRFQIKQKAWCYGRQVLTPLGIKIIDLSDQGIKILLAEKNLDLQKNIELLIFFESDNKIVYCKVKPCWSKYDQIFGCQVIESNLHWDNFCNLIYEELSLGKNIHRLAPKKSA